MSIATARTRLRSWLGDSVGIVIDADSDGLLTAALLSNEASVVHGRELPVVGAYDMSTLWLDSHFDLAMDSHRIVFADADVRIRGARVLSNHVLTVPGYSGLEVPPAGVDLCNPNYDLDGWESRGYREKYPFSTAGWVWALLGRAPVRTTTDREAFGLLMAQDSAIVNVDRYEHNCLAWELRLGPDSPYRPFYDAVRRDGKAGHLRRARDVITEAVDHCLVGASPLVERNASGHLTVRLHEDGAVDALADLHDRIADLTGLSGSVGLVNHERWERVLADATVVSFNVDHRDPSITTAFSLARTQSRTIKATMEWPSSIAFEVDSVLAAQPPRPDYET